jgi:hypothetical protein
MYLCGKKTDVVHVLEEELGYESDLLGTSWADEHQVWNVIPCGLTNTFIY